MRARVSVLGALVIATALAGCISTSQPLQPGTLGLPKAYDTSRGWSVPLSPAPYDLLPGVKQLVPSFDQTPIGLGLFFPKKEGCDWNATSLPADCKLPVVMDAGPYYEDHVQRDKFRPPLVEWLVPRGYAVVQMSVRGTGESGGCMELMSTNEQKDIDAMITWIASQPWSNGNVGMMGRSYDGTTPLMGAALANPHLKTIVPISSVSSVRDLMFKNGTSEFRGPIFHNLVYWASYGVGASPLGGVRPYRWTSIPEQVCPAVIEGTIEPGLTTLTGDASAAYFDERDFKTRIIENYKGSIWFVHGLEDWNVNPSMVVPWIRELRAAGIETKAWLGVWGHAYPDRIDEHRNVRWDWAEQTVRWFDHYLLGKGAKPALDVEVEDSLFTWRAEKTYPPDDAMLKEWELGVGQLAESGKATAGDFVLGGGAPTALTVGQLPAGTEMAGDIASFTSEPLAYDVRVAGLPQLHITATPTTAMGGWLFAELYDVFPDGRTWRIGWGAIDLRYHAGGNKDMKPLTPGQPVVARMEFEPTDAHLGQGHRLLLNVHKLGVEDILPSPSSEATVLSLGDGKSVLRLPVVERATILPTYVPPGLPSS